MNYTYIGNSFQFFLTFVCDIDDLIHTVNQLHRSIHEFHI